MVTLRSPVDLLTESFHAIGANLAGYLLAGLGVALVVVPLALAAVLLPYLGMGLGVFAGIATDNDDLGFVVGLLSFTLLLVGILLGIVVVTYPLYASLMRAIWLHQRQGAPLGLGAAFSTPLQDLGRVMAVMLAVSVAAATGALFCYVPGLLIGLMFQFALPGVVIDGLSPGEALSRSFHHARSHLTWHLGVFFLGLGIMLVVSQIPFVGVVAAAPLGFDFQLRAYRAAFPV